MEGDAGLLKGPQPWHATRHASPMHALWPNSPFVFHFCNSAMGNKIVTEASRRASPRPATPQGTNNTAGQGGGQRISLERGSHTRSKKNPGKRPHKGG